MNIFDPEKILIERDESGYVRLQDEKGKVHESVVFVPLFPFSDPDTYVSVGTNNNSKIEEIGIIENLKQLPKKQQKLIRDEINYRYVTPVIFDIKKITSKYRMHQWDVLTDKGEKTFFVRNRRENIHYRDDGHILIIDIDKCRYQVLDYRELSANALVELDRMLL